MHIARSTAYRLRQQARDEDKAALVFLDDRHGHPYKLTEPVRVWMVEFCTNNPQVASSRVQAELKSIFGIAVSVSQLNRVRAAHGVTRQGQSRIQGQGEKTEFSSTGLARRDWQFTAVSGSEASWLA